MNKYIKDLRDVRNSDVSEVGGKNASLGEMIGSLSGAGVRVPGGFALTSDAYWKLIDANDLRSPLEALMQGLDRRELTDLAEVASQARALVLAANWPDDVEKAVRDAYQDLGEVPVAVRSSATAEDLPTASFAGRHESFLNVNGAEALLAACIRCYASLFNERAIKYRNDMGFPDMKVALSIGVQRMVRADIGCAGVCFTLEPESGFRNVVHIAGNWGLGENVVQGAVIPDEYVVFKPTLKAGKQAILQRRLGAKQHTMVYAPGGTGSAGRSTRNMDTPREERERFTLSDPEVLQLARWALVIEEHYGMPMDIEWAKDGADGSIYIVQARPETIHTASDPYRMKTFSLERKGVALVKGSAVGSSIASGRVRKLNSPAEADSLKDGEVLVTDSTSHAAIVAREMGTVAIVGAGDATDRLADGQEVTVSCCEGRTGTVYEGRLEWTGTEVDLKKVKPSRTPAMLIVADPEQAFRHSFLPHRGVGLMRLEFVINNVLRIHPMALVRFEEVSDPKDRSRIEEITKHYSTKKDYFVEELSMAVGTIAAAFHPHDVIVRMSDFKSNEYANLIGGREFEPHEENPMLGFRGASRYYHSRYREGFQLECAAMKRVREDMGLTNVKLMIPFCRTVDEGRKVVELMAEFGLERGRNGLEVHMMTEIPSNVVQAKAFARYFDGFSIGSNDLTQLTLGIDRDSEIISDLFQEKDPAVMELIASVIASAKTTGTRIGLCGQAPSDMPEYARFLVEQGIDSISFNPDALLKGMENIRSAEQKLASDRVIQS